MLPLNSLCTLRTNIFAPSTLALWSNFCCFTLPLDFPGLSSVRLRPSSSLSFFSVSVSFPTGCSPGNHPLVSACTIFPCPLPPDKVSPLPVEVYEDPSHLTFFPRLMLSRILLSLFSTPPPVLRDTDRPSPYTSVSLAVDVHDLLPLLPDR